jgi:hypothetical protein
MCGAQPTILEKFAASIMLMSKNVSDYLQMSIVYLSVTKISVTEL